MLKHDGDNDDCDEDENKMLNFQAAPVRKSISYTMLLIYNRGEEKVERLIWGNNQQATQQQESFTFLYNDSLKK